ncbi:MAG TPA: hypothetical protein VHL77_06665, partial [Ferruginibacter sp.]|nr:hypothetical protein [Ferruginibacter sp.]
MRKTLPLLLVLLASAAQAQQAAYFDAAQAFNKLVMDRQNMNGEFIRVGTYKVIGTPYLFGEKNNGNVYSATEKAQNISLSYNVYNQQIEFYSTANTTNALVKEPGTLDSFKLKKNSAANIESDLDFIYGPLLNAKEKAYYQLLAKGPKVSLYKKYYAQLSIVSTNYIQSDLRQFDLKLDYYYTDSTN